MLDQQVYESFQTQAGSKADSEKTVGDILESDPGECWFPSCVIKGTEWQNQMLDILVILGTSPWESSSLPGLHLTDRRACSW